MEEATLDSLDWRSQAACASRPTNLFEVSKPGDRNVVALGGDKTRIRSHNLKKFEEAYKVCQGCPVRAACLEDATLFDKFWTVRGGQEPYFYGRIRKGGNSRRVPSANSDRFMEWSCKVDFHGRKHIAFRQQGDGTSRPYCVKCSNQQRAARRLSAG